MTVAVVGMGALGMLFGNIIQREIGENNFAFVMDEKRYKKNAKKEFTINGQRVDLHMMPVSKAYFVDLVIVAVKYPGLEEALDTIAPLVGSETIILSLLNGITSERILADRFGEEHVIDCVAQGMDAMHFGASLIYTKTGQIHIGIADDASEKKQYQMTALCKFFHGIGFPYVVEDDIRYRMWCKFMLNVGVNQVCMAYGVGYGKALRKNSKERMALVSAMREVALIAQAEGISIGEKEVLEYLEILETLDPNATPSMGQDRINKHPSEVEAFAGEVMRLGKVHHIETPTNDFLYHKIHKIEKTYV